MANPRLIKKRVNSIKNIGKITKALEMVSASKVQKSQAAAINAKPYAKAVYELVSSLAGSIKASEIPLLKIPQSIKSDLIIFISTNRGLCGSLNTNLYKFTSLFLLQKSGIKHSFVTIGKKGRSYASVNGELVADFSDEKDFGSIVSAVTKIITDGFTAQIYDAVYIIYPEFLNALSQETRVKKLLPISKIALKEELKRESFDIRGESGEMKLDQKTEESYTYEPDPVTVLGTLLPFYLEIQVAESLYESQASEHSARMIAMKNATDNSSELSESLTLVFNKARQSLITTEISDITTAQASLSD
ncbi:MAG: ATP synthase gamma chain [Microgenomates group bacterium GW2011_GWC1_37_8]|uniref:ATP synthase gamma chain n=1 Tax=Candidatus Woesebacteria bacterium GW2011_GWB1_38_8 TaxID=1618570 RepID=A0A0G0NK16_9BACT|nr:MAG: ATP synthase gamma chain [Microgenomates group bacterium GW2011_GWC1_37_8]KKQ86234.1 MAG: ATP synthase gamma chain [Candidatus Woesebacteria bacterium GW2011_GWB1_38_8]